MTLHDSPLGSSTGVGYRSPDSIPGSTGAPVTVGIAPEQQIRN